MTSSRSSLLLPPRHAQAAAVRALIEQREKATAQAERDSFNIPGSAWPTDAFGNRTGLADWVRREDAMDIPEYVWVRIPEPVGWRILVQEYAPPKVSRGGVIYADQSGDWHNASNFLGRVLAIGPTCYQHPKFLIVNDAGQKVLQDPWCRVGEWVTFAHFSGNSRKIEHDGEEWRFRSVADENIIETAPTPDGLKVYA